MLVCSLFVSRLDTAFAQDSLLIGQLLERIAQWQVTASDSVFLEGIFPSYINNRERFADRKIDNDVFFNAIIAYTLNDLKPYLSTSERALVDTIRSRSKKLYPRFKNRKGRNTYNFWRTDSLKPFPYSRVLNWVNKDYHLPDDLDDSALLLLALEEDIATAQQLHLLMQGFLADTNHVVRTRIDSWMQGRPVYSAWFGQKIPVVPDVSVLCNVLSFVQHYHLPWTMADTASLMAITETIDKRLYFTKPMYASPYYGKPAIILYHIARLMDVRKIPELEQRKTKLITDAKDAFASAGSNLEKLLLLNALYKWEETDLPVFTTPTVEELQRDDYPFFIGNIPSYFKPGWQRYFTRNGYLMYYHYCPAYNDVVLLEYMVLRKKAEQ